MTKGSDLLVAALEREGVDRIFGVPGEENLDVVESLRTSSIELVLTRHEQGAAFMAATHGRLTGRPGVCIATLGPGALNFSTGAAYAHLGAMPMIMITGQKAIMTARQARFQIVDVIASMKPLTKMTRQIVSAASIPAIVREAFRVAMEERPGPVHLELPEDVAGEETEPVPLIPPHPVDIPVAHPAALDRAAEMILAAKRPLIMLGAAASRPRSTSGLANFVLRTRIPFFTTQMGKGTVPGGSNLYMGTAALSERDYVHEAIDRGRPDHRHRPRHDREAALHHGRGRAAGDPCQLHAGQRRGGLLPACRGRRRRRAEPGTLGRSARGQADERRRAAVLARAHPEPHRGSRHRGPVPAHAAAPRARCPARDPKRRDRVPRQRHVQDLVCPQLPHLRGQHAPARQRARHDGRGPALGHDGQAALPGAARAGGVRRRRVHDELDKSWRPRCGWGSIWSCSS